MIDVLEKITRQSDNNPDKLIELVNKLRPTGRNKKQKIIKNVENLIRALEQDEFIRKGFSSYLSLVFRYRKFSSVITENGIIKNQSIYKEFKKRIVNKLLPNQPSEDSFNYLLSNMFFKSDDYIWVNYIQDEQWEKLLELTGIIPLSEKKNNDFAVIQILTAIEILALRISGMGVNEELLKMAPEYNKLENPFITLVKETNILFEQLTKSEGSRTSESIDIRQLYIIIEQCNECVDKMVKNRKIFGITFETTVKIARIKQELDRLELVLNFLTIEKGEKRFGKLIAFIRNMIELNCTKNNVGAFFDYSTGMVAHQITQHTGKTGEQYITNTKKEYIKMLYSALGGGVIVGLLCIIKVFLSYKDVSPLGEAFLYSMNYSIGFILIYLMGYTLATKQPAMTASTLAQAIHIHKKNPDYSEFGNLFARLFRSQFIAFIGNVLMAFPVALLAGYLLFGITGDNPVKPYKAESLLRELNPFLSLALLHASIAGFYLFLSGLISGYYINNNIHNKVSYRYRKHPFLKSVLPENILNKFADFYDKKIGGISGNFWFGVFLGSTGVVGYFIGIPIDIRHITFAAGNFALALVGLEFSVSVPVVIVSILCIGLIGFFNFIVSFTLSLFLAMRSRKIPLKNIQPMFQAVLNVYQKNPKSFFLPPDNHEFDNATPAETLTKNVE